MATTRFSSFPTSPKHQTSTTFSAKLFPQRPKHTMSLSAWLLVLIFFATPPWVAAKSPAPLTIGVDANYFLAMEEEGKAWRWEGQKKDLFQGIAEQKVRGLRVRLWTKDEGQNGKTYATSLVKRALAAGLDPYLVLFLSEDWADLMKQPAPEPWRDLGLAKRAHAVRTYSKNIVTHFRKAGLTSHLYEIGNEIDYGICGVYPANEAEKTPEILAKKLWPQAAMLIRASQEGVLQADPQAKFMLHIAHWWDADFAIAFFQSMLEHGVQIDYAGLSYFPSANIGGSLEITQFGAVVDQLKAAIERPVIVAETAYPSTDNFQGQFAGWKVAAPGYPLTPDGQQRWLRDFLAFAARHPAVHSVYYWSPEWFGEGMWKGFALFDEQGEAKPAWSAFATAKTPSLAKNTIYWEVVGERVFAVPVEKARTQALLVLREELRRIGAITPAYIKAIAQRTVIVDGYRVDLNASFAGNLDLAMPQKAEPLKGVSWEQRLAAIDPWTEQIVLFPRGESPTTTRHLLSLAEKHGITMIVHEKTTGTPLKFGLGNAWQKGVVE